VVALDRGRVEQLAPLAAGAGAEEVPVAAPQFGDDAGGQLVRPPPHALEGHSGEVFDPLLAGLDRQRD
jgi:hypothetical protein